MGEKRHRGVVTWLLVAGALITGVAAAVTLASRGGAAPSRTLVPATRPTPILVVGTFHFAGSSDVNYERPDGVLAEARQRDLEEISRRISTFRPTKVLLEWSSEHEEATNERYRAYLNGGFTLGENEVYQIGFRVARMSGLQAVHLIDHPLGIENGRRLADKLGQAGVFAALEAENREWNERRPRRERDSWVDVFIDMNLLENIRRDHSFYIDALPMVGREGEYDGTDVAATWYKRNLRIYTNIARLNVPGDRLFLLIGAGHVGVLRELFGSSRRFVLVDPVEYLSGAASQDEASPE